MKMFDMIQRLLKCGAWLALIVFLSLLSWLVWDVRVAVNDTRVQVKAAIQNVNSITAQAAQAIGEVRAVAEQEKAYWTAIKQKSLDTMEKSSTTLENAATFLKDLNENLNGKQGTLPAMTRTLNASTETLEKTQKEILEAISGLRKDITPILKNAAQATEDVVKITGDPELKRLLVQLNSLTEELNRSADHGTEILATAALTMKRIDDRMKQILKPGNMVWSAIKGLLGIGADVAVIQKP